MKSRGVCEQGMIRIQYGVRRSLKSSPRSLPDALSHLVQAQSQERGDDDREILTRPESYRMYEHDRLVQCTSLYSCRARVIGPCAEREEAQATCSAQLESGEKIGCMIIAASQQPCRCSFVVPFSDSCCRAALAMRRI